MVGDARSGHFCSRVSLETKPRRPKGVVAKERRVVGRQPEENRKLKGPSPGPPGLSDYPGGKSAATKRGNGGLDHQLCWLTGVFSLKGIIMEIYTTTG